MSTPLGLSPARLTKTTINQITMSLFDRLKKLQELSVGDVIHISVQEKEYSRYSAYSFDYPTVTKCYLVKVLAVLAPGLYVLSKRNRYDAAGDFFTLDELVEDYKAQLVEGKRLTDLEKEYKVQD